MMAKLRRCRSYLSQCVLLRRPPAPRSRHDGIAAITVLDHMPIGAFADRRPRRLDLDAQRRAALNAWAGPILLCRRGAGHPGRCNGERRKPDDPYAHGLSSLERATLPHCGGDVNRQPHSTPFDTVSDNVSRLTWGKADLAKLQGVSIYRNIRAQACQAPPTIFFFCNRDKSAR
jgi:hypothetical protein